MVTAVSSFVVAASFAMSGTGLTVVAIGMAAADQVWVPPSCPEMSLEALKACAESASRTERAPGVPW